MSDKQFKVLIVEDHIALGQAWQKIISDEGYKVVGICTNESEAVHTAKNLNPDIVLMDINLKKGNGLQATTRIKKNNSEIRIIALSMHSDRSHVNEMLKNGVDGYVTKVSPRKELLHAITEVLNGNNYICEEVRNKLDQN
ncbi:MAG: response regulator transcription factor [Brumimicrobium sp.]|nr:response regulator transcription factor [Brumimicrobium sp.]